MAAIPEANQQEETEPSTPPPFSVPDAGADYFATETHYQALAARIIMRLRAGPGFGLVTADPPPDPRRLAPALTEAAAGAYTVTIVTCGPELNREHLLRAAPSLAAPLFVFDGADGLADVQLNGLCEALASGDGVKPAAVMLARPSCVARLDRLQPRLSREGLASHFPFSELGRDEVEAFIRRQLPGEQGTAFTAEALSAIADFSGGDPATVNRLALLIASFAQQANSRADKKTDDAVLETEGAPQPALEALTLERRPPRRLHRGAGFLVGIILCLTIVGFALMLADQVATHSAWLTPLYDLISKELANEGPVSEPGPAPFAPIAAAPAIASAEPQPPAAEAAEAEQVTPPPALPMAATVEPKPLPTPTAIEAQPVRPSPGAPATGSAEPKPLPA